MRKPRHILRDWYRKNKEQVDKHGRAFIGGCQFVSALLVVGIAAEFLVNSLN